MPIRLTILSGSRQGDVLETANDCVQVGNLPGDDMRFDPDTDPGIRDRRATLRREENGWNLYCSGSESIYVNHNEVEKPEALRSGDIVRMSHDGPDFSFELLAKLSTTPSAPPADDRNVPAKKTTEIPRAPDTIENEAVETAAVQDLHSLPFDVRKLAVLAMVAAVAIVGLAWWFNSKPVVTVVAPKFDPFPVLNCKEGDTILWRPALRDHNAQNETTRFQFDSDVPQGMSIDEKLGSVKWVTTEAHGPGEYRCRLKVTNEAAGQTLVDTQSLEIRVQEVNRPPIPARMPTQKVNLRVANLLQAKLAASDPDTPHQKLSFRLGPEAPDGVALDPTSGQVTWRIDAQFANRDVSIPFLVTDDAAQPLTAEGVLRVQISSPDAWSTVEQKLRDSTYLLVAMAKPGDTLVPLGTGCAIADQTLLTSASIAYAANKAMNNGWTVMALDTKDFDLSDPRGVTVTEIKSHAAYVTATTAVQQAFFDLALFTTDKRMPSTCKLGDVEASAKNGQQVGCFGYTIYGGSLTRFDRPNPIFKKVTLLEVIPPPNQTTIPGEPLLLQLMGELPFQPYGSLIVNEDAEVLGVYAVQGVLPDDASDTAIHYAPDIVHARAYLADSGRDLWMKPNEVPLPTVNNTK